MDSSNFILSTSGEFIISLSEVEIKWNPFTFTANYFQLEKILDDTYVRDFLENDTQRILSASLNDSRKSIQFQNKIPNEYENVLLFYKTQHKRDSQPKGNRSDLGMLTLEGGVVKSIYNSLTSIFMPSAINVSKFVLMQFEGRVL